jgi:TBC1 domain family member 4
MEFLKVDLTQMDTSKMEEVFNQIISLDISKQLTVYEIEYNVIQEEMQFSANVSIFEE